MPEVILNPTPEPSISFSRTAERVFGPGEWPFEKPHYVRYSRTDGTEPWEVASLKVTYTWSSPHDEWRVVQVRIRVVNIKKDGTRGVRDTNYDLPDAVRAEAHRLAALAMPTSVVTVDEEF